MKEHSKNKARWFQFSYDAGRTVTDKTGKYGEDDFRRTIINILLDGKVLEMEEIVETTIWFKCTLDLTIQKMLDYWKNEFNKIGVDFYYLLTPIVQLDNGEPVNAMKPNPYLKSSFNTLVKEEKKKKNIPF